MKGQKIFMRVTEPRSCAEVAVLGSPSLIVLVDSVDVTPH